MAEKAQTFTAGDRVHWHNLPRCEGTVLKNNGGMCKVQWDTGDVHREEPEKLRRVDDASIDASTLRAGFARNVFPDVLWPPTVGLDCAPASPPPSHDKYGPIKMMRAWPAVRDGDGPPDASALSRALAMHDALPDTHRPPDNTPLRNCLPGIWPTVGDLRALLARRKRI